MIAAVAFVTGLAACAVGALLPEARGESIIVAFVCLLGGLRALDD